MSDEYGSHVDQKEYPRGTPYKKNPAIIDTYDPNEKPSKPGEGARASDTYGAHYRDPKYQIPRGGVPLTAHGIPESMDLNETERAQARGERNEAPRTPRRVARAAASAGSGTEGRVPRSTASFTPTGTTSRDITRVITRGRSNSRNSRARA